MNKKFRLGITRDFLDSDKKVKVGDIGLELLDKSTRVDWEFLRGHSAELTSKQIQGYDAIIMMGGRITAATLEGANNLALIARYGAGYDAVDVDACNRKGVLLTNTPDGVRRPVASSFMTFILALSHNMMAKDRITRAGRWNEQMDHIGIGLTGRVVGMVGLGSIGHEVLNLAKPWGMRHIAYDPYVSQKDADRVGAELVDLETLMSTADFVCVCCLLNDETRNLINQERISLMHENSFLINISRGPVVNQQAITEALQERRIRGAALDVFEQEPIDDEHPLLKLDNVIVTPHAICMTDECFLLMGKSAIRSALDVAEGNIPEHVINRSVIRDPRFQDKLGMYRLAHAAD